MAGELQSWRVRQKEKGVRQPGGGLEWRDTRKLEGGRAQQRCKVVGNQGRGKSEEGAWTE